jgi:mRNA interferase MazF
MRRGEVWWIDFGPPIGRRPAVLVSRDQAYRVRTSVTVVPLTRKARGIPVEVSLGPEDGIPVKHVANADSLMTIPRARCAAYLTTLSPARMEAVARAIRFALALPG